MPASALLLGASVASLNLCTDELLLLLAEPRQIASVSHLSHDPAESALWRSARHHRANDGSLLSVAPLRPKVVLTMGGGARDRAGIARRLGMQVIDLPFATDLRAVQANIRTVAKAVSQPARGEMLARRIQALQRTAAVARVDTIWLGGGGRTVSPTGLDAQWMALAGLRQRRLAGDRVALETLLLKPPQLLLRSDYRAGQYSGAQRWLDHPLARRAGHVRSIRTDGRLWTCSGPLLVGEVQRLRSIVTP